MPYLYRRLPEGHPLAPAWEEFEFPLGRPLSEVCAENGWLQTPPDGEMVYSSTGEPLRELPVAAVAAVVPPPAPAPVHVAAPAARNKTNKEG